MSFVIDKTLEIDAPAEVVWNVITDLPRYREWNPFVVDAKSTLKPGDPIDMQVKLRDKPQFQSEVITEFNPGKGFAYRMKPMPLGALRSLRSHAVEPLGPGRSRYVSHFEIDGWLQFLVLALFREALQRGFEGMSQGIKARAEQLHTARRAA